MPNMIHSAVEVTNVSKHGFWLLLGTEELLVPFAQFPWFKSATIEQSVASIRHPAAFALISKALGDC
jgi:hypothetical protein